MGCTRKGYKLASGLALPAAILAIPSAAATASAGAQQVKRTYRTLCKTGLKVTALSFGRITTSDQSVTVLGNQDERGWFSGIQGPS